MVAEHVCLPLFPSTCSCPHPRPAPRTQPLPRASAVPQKGVPRCVPQPYDPCIAATCPVGEFCQVEAGQPMCITNW